MTEMQRYGMHANGTVRAVPYLDGDWVLASEAEAAIAAAAERAVQPTQFAYEQGQRDALARCIAAVEAERDRCLPPNGLGYASRVLAALRALDPDRAAREHLADLEIDRARDER